MITTYIVIGIIIIILIILATWEKSRFRIYWKSESHTALVRTGLGGSKAFVGGGAFLIPLLHKVQWVDLSETRFFVKREKENSIITKNLLRADIEMEVHIRVKADKKNVEQAAIALGKRADNTDGLGNFLEPTLLNALQSVSSGMSLQEIHQNREDYAARVRGLLADELIHKGLELTSISLCSFAQTKIDFYDPNSIFDSEGIVTIKRITEKRKKERNDIEQENTILIQEKDTNTRKITLELEKERAFAEQDNKKEIESQKEEREKELTQIIMDQRLLAESARLKYGQELKERQLLKERTEEEQRIKKESVVEKAEIDKQKEIETHRIETEKAIEVMAIRNEIELVEQKRNKEEANIELDRQINAMQIDREKDVTARRIAKDLEIELAEVDKSKASETAKLSIQEALSLQKKANILAMIEELESQTKSEEAEHEMLSVKIKSQAERQKVAATIRAEMDAAVKKIQEAIEVEMESHRIKNLAKAKCDAAENEAQTIERLSDANRKDALLKAEGERAMIEARNVISEHIMKDARMSQLIGEISSIAAELMKPAEKIDSIKVVQIDGMGGGSFYPQNIVEGGDDQSILSFGGAHSAIATIIGGMLQVGAFKPVFRQLFGSEEIGELDFDRFVAMLKDMVPGLIEEGAKSYVKESVKQKTGELEKS